jgi:DDE domain
MDTWSISGGRSTPQAKSLQTVRKLRDTLRGVRISRAVTAQSRNKFRKSALSATVQSLASSFRTVCLMCAGPVLTNQARCYETDAHAPEEYAFAPERLVTDDVRSYSSAARKLGIEPRRERGRWKNNRAENSYQPTPRLERKMQRFKSPGVSPEISLHTRRHLQHLQRPTPPRLSPNAPCASRLRDDHLEDRGRSGLTILEAPTLRARGLAT